MAFTSSPYIPLLNDEVSCDFTAAGSVTMTNGGNVLPGTVSADPSAATTGPLAVVGEPAACWSSPEKPTKTTTASTAPAAMTGIQRPMGEGGCGCWGRRRGG